MGRDLPLSGLSCLLTWLWWLLLVCCSMMMVTFVVADIVAVDDVGDWRILLVRLGTSMDSYSVVVSVVHEISILLHRLVFYLDFRLVLSDFALWNSIGIKKKIIIKIRMSRCGTGILASYRFDLHFHRCTPFSRLYLHKTLSHLVRLLWNNVVHPDVCICCDT